MDSNLLIKVNIMITQYATITGRIRKTQPLVHNITNMVVMNITANALLAIGASPVMAHAVEEIPDMVSLASSLVINIGTLDPRWIESMLIASNEAKKKSIPIVFDPVGAGATRYRTEQAKKILQEGSPSIIRGNASEIMSLVDSGVSTKGVDSSQSSISARDAALKLAQKYNCTVVVSGEVDLIVTGDRITEVRNGDPMMTKVTGIGCVSTAIIGACAAVSKDMHDASIAGMLIVGVSGERAVKTLKEKEGSGTFAAKFIDELYGLTEDILCSEAKIIN